MTSMESKINRIKTARYTEESLKNALADIREKQISIRKVCKQYGIPKTTLLDRIHSKSSVLIKKRGPDPILGNEGEAKIVEWLLKISKCGFSVKKQELLDTVQKIIKVSKTPNKFKNDRPGQTWYLNFLKRNPVISCRSAKTINRARTQVTEAAIRLWFRELQTFLDGINQSDILNHPERIFNGEEIGFALCPKTGNVLGPKDLRNLDQIKQGNDKGNLSVLITFNAKGDLCQPCVVFPYVRPPRAVMESMPPDWCLGRSESGWMTGDVFFEYVTNDFNNWVERNNIKKPVLLLVDGHKSHMSLVLSTVCEQMQIILYALPPNTNDILQPADVSVLAPLKSNWENTVKTFLSNPENGNTSVTKTNFCRVFQATLQETNLKPCIENDFKRCGLYPFDPNAPDYTKCVRNTLQNINETRDTKLSKEINRSDIAITKKVLKQLKTALKHKNIKVSLIIKELNNLKKTLPYTTKISSDIKSDSTKLETL